MAEGPDGCEFLLAFPDGAFSESSTFLLSEVFARTPRDVLSANFGVPEAAFDCIPKEQLFIFEAPVPGSIESDAIASPQGAVPRSMILRASDQRADQSPGGSVRIADTRNFPIATEVAAAIVEVAPKSMREIHWHPDADEWQYYLSGTGRMTVFASQDSSLERSELLYCVPSREPERAKDFNEQETACPELLLSSHPVRTDDKPVQ